MEGKAEEVFTTERDMVNFEELVLDLNLGAQAKGGRTKAAAIDLYFWHSESSKLKPDYSTLCVLTECSYN